jgi:hypothetical protein
MSSDLSSSFLQFKVEMFKGSNHSLYQFDEFGLDAERLMFCPEGQKVPLPLKGVKTLAVLVENGEFGGDSGSGHQFLERARDNEFFCN